MIEQKIIDIAVKDIFYVTSDTSIKKAIETITDKKIRNLVVRDTIRESYFVLSVGDVVSMVTDTMDLDLPVSFLNLRQLALCAKNISVLEAVMLFGDNNAIVGIVDDDGTLAGIVTYSNVLNAIYGYEDDSFKKPIKDLLAKESVLKANIGDSLSDYLDELNSSATDCLIILKDDLPYGIITKRDIVKMLAKNISLEQNVELLMSYPLKTVDSELSINNALTYMQDNKLKRVIVVDSHGKLAGVITQKDILDAIYTRLTQKGFLNLNKINTFLKEQVDLKTMELQQLNKELELRIEKATAELLKNEKELSEMKRNEALFELLKNMAHHWRQPLNTISLLAQESEMIIAGNGDINGVIKNQKSIVSEAMSLSSTIDKMSEIYKYGNVRVENITPDFKKIVDYIVDNVADKHKISCELSYEIDDFELKTRIPTIKFILKELVSNSINAALKNGKKTIKLHFLVKRRDEYALIAFRDDAGGISDEHIDFVFDPYFTTEFKSRDKGLGLYMVKNLVEESLNGKIAVSSIDGGTEFELKIPLLN